MIVCTALGIASLLAILALYIFGCAVPSAPDGPLLFGMFVFGITALGCGLILLIVGGSRSVGRGACHSWGKQAGRSAKFVITYPLDTGKCLTLAPDGRWINKDDIIFNIPAERK